MIGNEGIDRSRAWLPLLRRLTERAPTWTAMKGIESALAGTGDVDSVAPTEEWAIVVREFRDWAEEYRLGPVVVCPHAPHLLHLIALDPQEAVFYELDVNRRKIFLGSTLFTPRDLFGLSLLDERGFRRLRPGAEGLFKLVQNGAKRGGRPDWNGIRRKRVIELLRADPVGVQEGARLFGAGRFPVLALAASLMRGRWNRVAMLAVEASSLARALLEPSGTAARIRFRLARKRCPVLRTVFEGERRVPKDRVAWLEEVSRSHTIYAAGAATRGTSVTSPAAN